MDVYNISNYTKHINNNSKNTICDFENIDLNCSSNNKKPFKTLNLKDISCNNCFKSNDNDNIDLNSSNNSVYFYKNKCIFRSIAKIIKESLEQVNDNCSKV